MFDFSWTELMVIGAVALVVIGPKDLPKALKTAGLLLRRARGMAREFQNSIDDMIREADLEEVRKSVQDTTRLDHDKTSDRTAEPGGALMQKLWPERPPPADLPASAAEPTAAPAPAKAAETTVAESPAETPPSAP
jgi:sec-independent protein translocase protein TatB